jgi:hypothetical protein
MGHQRRSADRFEPARTDDRAVQVAKQWCRDCAGVLKLKAEACEEAVRDKRKRTRSLLPPCWGLISGGAPDSQEYNSDCNGEQQWSGPVFVAIPPQSDLIHDRHA